MDLTEMTLLTTQNIFRSAPTILCPTSSTLEPVGRVGDDEELISKELFDTNSKEPQPLTRPHLVTTSFWLKRSAQFASYQTRIEMNVLCAFILTSLS